MSPEMILAKMLATPQYEVEKTAEVEDQSLVEAMDKLSWAEDMGRELAKEHMEKVAVTLPGMGSVLKGAKSGLGQAMHATMGATKGMRAGVGAAGGAVLGGAAGAMKDPGVNQQTGQKNSRLGNIAGGMALGGAGGAAVGLGARKAIGAMGASQGAIGKATRGTMQAGIRSGAAGIKDTRRLGALTAMGGGERKGLAGAVQKRFAAPAGSAGLVPGGAPAKAGGSMTDKFMAGATDKGPPPLGSKYNLGSNPKAGAPMAQTSTGGMTGEQARVGMKQSLGARIKQGLGMEATPDSVAQARAAHKIHTGSVIDPAVLYKLMVERTGRG